MDRRVSVWLISSIALLQLPTAIADLGERWYGGVSAVRSQLTPDTSNSVYSVTQDNGTGFGAIVGFDMNHWLSFEAAALNLGRAQLTRADGESGQLFYSAFHLSALSYLPLQKRGFGSRGDLSARTGASVFARLGISSMGNQTSLPYRRRNDLHLTLGGGLEWATREGHTFRLGSDYMAGDAVAISMSYLKRFPLATTYPVFQIPLDENPDLVESTPVTVAANQSTEQPQISPAKPLDKNLGLKSSTTRVVADLAKLQVVAKKPDLDLPMPTLLFSNNSVELALNELQASELMRLSKMLKTYPDLHIAIQGFSSTRGSVLRNQVLSESRAHSVWDYLVALGVSPAQLQVEGRGVDASVSDHEARRVELKVVDPSS